MYIHSYQILLLILIIYIINAFNYHHYHDHDDTKTLVKKTHHCIHDKVAIEPIVGPYEEQYAQEHMRMLQSNSWASIRIYADYTNFTNNADITSTQQSLIQNQLMQQVISYFQNSLQVIPYPTTLYVNGNICSEVTVPSMYKVGSQGVPNADLLLFVTATNEPNENFAAWATACYTSSYNGRPIVGQININLAFLTLTDIESEVMTAIHETLHVLVFSSSFFSKYRDSSNNVIPQSSVVATQTIRYANTKVMILPDILNLVRNYFNCPTMAGMELENEGGSGSKGNHWESRLVRDEVMTAQAATYSVVSQFTATLLNASGWYRFNDSMYTEARFGYHSGCNFVNNLCVINTTSPYTTISNEFCTGGSTLNGQENCTWDGWAYGKCSLFSGSNSNSNWWYFGSSIESAYSFVDNCPVIVPYSNGDCRYGVISTPLCDQIAGPTSRCFMVQIARGNYAMPTSIDGACFNSWCLDNFDGTYTLSFNISNLNVTCPINGGTIPAPSGSSSNNNYRGTIQCPPSYRYCVYKKCPNNCSSNGQCINGKCQCTDKSSATNQTDCSSINSGSNGGNAGTGTNTTNGTGTGTGNSTNTNTSTCISTTSCSSNGYCSSNGTCICYDGWGSSDCSKEVLVYRCSKCKSILDCYGNTCVCSPLPNRNCTLDTARYNEAYKQKISILFIISIFFISYWLV